jgi:hypothetical protein
MSALSKTTVYLTSSDYARLKALARRKKCPTALLVREAVVEYTERHGQALRPESLGAGHSGRKDLSERAEALLVGMGRKR